MIKIDVDAKSVLNKITKIISGLPKVSRKVENDSADLGVKKAVSKVPKDSGATASRIIKRQIPKAGFEVVSTTHPSDLINRKGDPGKDLAPLLERGEVSKLNWGKTTSPLTGQFHFIEATAIELRTEIPSLLNKEIEMLVN